MTVIDVERIRADFPALARTHAGQHVAYLDGPGGTQVPTLVVDAMAHYLLHHNANTHWNYPTSVETDAALADARATFAAFVNGAPGEIVFGNNMTTITFHLARALGREWKAGDEVIVTELDHHGNIAPWQAIAQERGIVLRWLPLGPSRSELDLDQLESLLSPRTRLLAIGAASNLLGTVTDVAKAAAIAHRTGALVLVDAVHYAPHFLPDVATLGCDFLVCSAYKFHGPHVGVLWGRSALLEALDAPKLVPAPDSGPERWEIGTQNHEGIVGAAAAVRWIASLADDAAPLRPALQSAYAGLHQYEKDLLEELWRGLHDIPGVTCFGYPPRAARTPTVSFAVAGRSAADVARHLAHAGCFVSDGDFYATTAAERIGHPEGVVRIGLACYNTREEITRALTALASLS